MKLQAEGKRFTIISRRLRQFIRLKNNDRDYRKTINGECFKKFLVDQLVLPLSGPD